MKRILPKLASLLGGLVILTIALFLLFGLSRLPRPSTLPQPENGQLPAGPQLLYAELKGESSTLWIAPPERPKERKALARITHQTGYGIKARLSPDGAMLAYTALPPDTKEPNQAPLWWLELAETTPQLLAEGVDLRSAPVWSPDGKRLAYRRTTELATGALEIELYMVDLAERKKTKILADSSSVGLYPFAWSTDGRVLYYSRIVKGGTDLVGLELMTGTPRFTYHVADGIARDFQLSPDGKWILYSMSEKRPTGFTYSVAIVDVADGTRVTLKEGDNNHFSPIWNPDGRGVTISSEQSDPLGGGAIVALLIAEKTSPRLVPPPSDGFDIPLAWSPDGKYLAITHFKGKPAQPTSRTLVVVSVSEGRRFPVESAGDIQFIGWLSGN